MQNAAALPIATRNYRLVVAYTVTQYTPLYWAYMYHLVTEVRGLDATDYGLLKALYYLSVVVLEFPLGVLADRVGRKRTLLLGALFNCLGCGLYVVASDLATFALAEVAFDFATAFASGAVSALLYDSLARDGRAAEYPVLQSRLWTVTLVVGTLAFPLTDLLLVRGGDPTLAYAATGVVLVVGALCAVGLHEPPLVRASAVQIARGALRDVVHTPAIGRLLLWAGAVFVLMRAANSLLFNPVLAASGVPVDAWGTVLAAVGLIGAFGAWRAPWLLRRAGSAATRALLPALLVAMYLLLAAASGPTAVALLATHGLAVGALSVVSSSLLNDLMPASERRATVLSLESLVSRGLYGLASIALGTALDLFPLDTVLVLTAAVGCLPLAAMLLLRRAR